MEHEAHALNPRTWEEEQVEICEFEVSLVYKVSSRTTRDGFFVCLFCFVFLKKEISQQGET